VSQVAYSKVGYANSPVAVNSLLLKPVSVTMLFHLTLAQILIIQCHKWIQIYFLQGIKTMKLCDESISKTFKLVEAMLDLADRGDAVRQDDGCGILYGVVRDSAFKIKKLAEAERDAHMKRGWWKE
jgi:hypothetical protein